MAANFEDRTIVSVWMPTMEIGVRVINEIECAHLLLHVTPHTSAAEAYWFVFKNDSRLYSNLRSYFPYLKTLPASK